ncbi:MBOAT family O-acyltransferase [Bradyrhizobium sp. HKCCYLS20291]|uniref:MBOAT family O-acyltransferase n=1 Tax=Bradyrhizobium sp. HKCCYLS20291 TaxID=3420766 RepID=UPI003EB8A969
MLFTQFEFIFLFLPVTFAGYFVIGRSFADPAPRLAWLAAASLVFYANWDVSFVPIIVTSIVVNYVMGLLIARQTAKPARTRLFAMAVAANLLALAFFKYTNFGIDIIDAITRTRHSHLDIALPLGISFFTFTQLAYLADVYAGLATERSFIKYTLFVTYFPHLIAGPILHHREMMPQFGSEESKRLSAERVATGLTIFIIGLFKKAVIADGFALIANPVFQTATRFHLHAIDAWGGALAYSLQIYFDFSGYCDMAIGLSLLFGIRLPFNFDAPYKSHSIIEFWRRWHITLSRFLRDYLYIPLGGNRQGPTRRRVNLFLTMLIGGLWHGAGFTFVIWGALHGLYLIVNHLWREIVGRSPALQQQAGKIWYAVTALVLTQFAVVIAWVFFRADTPKIAGRVLRAMVGASQPDQLAQTTTVTWLSLAAVIAGYAACLLLPNVNAMFERWNVGLDSYSNPRRWSVVDLTWRPSTGWAVAASLVCTVALLVSLLAGDGSQFLYFQF